MVFTWVIKNKMRNSLNEWKSFLAEGSELNNPVVIKIRSRREVQNIIEKAGFRVVKYGKKGFVSNYLPLIGKYLKKDGYFLNLMAYFLGWYHCFICKKRKK